jgi:hypothetical protein
MLLSSRAQCTNDPDDRQACKTKKDSILPYRKCSLYRPKYAQRNEKDEPQMKNDKHREKRKDRSRTKNMQQYI